MAIFEKSLRTKGIVDDTEKLLCTVENAQNINKHTVSVFFCCSHDFPAISQWSVVSPM